MRTMPYRQSLVIVTSLIVLPASARSAQQRVELDRFRACACTVHARLEAILGDPNGDGSLESDKLGIAFDPHARRYAVYSIPGSIQFFSERGKYQSKVRRVGRGPGEMQLPIAARFVDGRLLIQDAGNGKWLIMDTLGTLMREAPLAVRPGGFVTFGSDSVVVGSFDRQPASAGYPLHLLTISDPRNVRHFGSASGEWSVASISQVAFVAKQAETKEVWVAFPEQLQFQAWSLSGRLLRIVYGQPAWFPRVLQWEEVGQRSPQTRLRSFVIDRNDRLWILSRVADSRWKEASRAAMRAEGNTIRDLTQYFDTRLDIFDLRKSQVLGTHTWDSPGVQLVDRESDAAAALVEYYQSGVPRISVIRFAVVNAINKEDP
jgi:hypothetical protein